MPLRRRRFELTHTSAPRTAQHKGNREPDERSPRAVPPVRVRTWQRGLFRRAPSTPELRRRIDELAADAEAWIAELKANEDDRSNQPLR
jgi:hypothetical protein